MVHMLLLGWSSSVSVPLLSFELRRENELKLPHDWLCYLAPEIVREMAPGKDEDKLPFSKAADIYAFG